jgi:hypothetical protein
MLVKIMRPLCFPRIIILIVENDPKLKSIMYNAIHSNQVKKSIKYDFQYMYEYISKLSFA